MWMMCRQDEDQDKAQDQNQDQEQNKNFVTPIVDEHRTIGPLREHLILTLCFQSRTRPSRTRQRLRPRQDQDQEKV